MCESGCKRDLTTFAIQDVFAVVPFLHPQVIFASPKLFFQRCLNSSCDSECSPQYFHHVTTWEDLGFPHPTLQAHLNDIPQGR